MEIRLSLQSNSIRLIAGIVGIAVCGALAFVVLNAFITGVLADERVLPHADQLESYVKLWPESARIQAKLAEARLADPDRDLKAVESGARLACELSPFDYHHRMLLASIEEAAGDRQAAEDSLNAARVLAPNSTEVAWRQANLMLRTGKLAEAQAFFRTACANDPPLLPVTLDTLWRASDGSAAALESVTPSNSESRLNLAGFLLLQSQGADAARVFGGIPRADALKLANTPVFISSMIRAGEWNLARSLWGNLIGADQQRMPLVWNGGFEDASRKGLNQFDWIIESGSYASAKIDTSAARSGSRSLKIEFLGRDTTKLDREITQQVVLQASTRYRLECFARTDRLDTPEGPEVVISNLAGEPIAVSAPIAPGTNDWHRVTLDFTSPASKNANVMVTVSIKRKPKFSYDEPTRGTIWFDDFSIAGLESSVPGPAFRAGLESNK